MKIVWLLVKILVFILLTVVTQVGGLVFLLALWLSYFLKKNNIYRRFCFGGFSIVFTCLYIIISFGLVPLIAKPLGRVPLPINGDSSLKPLNCITFLLNRHYVTPELKFTIEKIALEVHNQHPQTIINYLDANFPFCNGFPLFPHLSHSDGKKLDLSFLYLDAKTHQITNHSPSFLGYGVCEEPSGKEVNTALNCEEKGFWQYSFLSKMVSQDNKNEFLFDASRNKFLIETIARQKVVSKIFIEPHLKDRLGLSLAKIKFHGCRAVRHDDHIHLQIR